MLPNNSTYEALYCQGFEQFPIIGHLNGINLSTTEISTALMVELKTAVINVIAVIPFGSKEWGRTAKSFSQILSKTFKSPNEEK